jgi:uncharacterized protein
MKPINNYNKIVSKTSKLVKNYMNDLNDVSHDFIHICLVLKFALLIAKKEGIIDKRDLFHIKMGALLHDIGDSKYTKDNQAIIINSFLDKNISGINKYDKNEIIRISSNISLSKDNYNVCTKKINKKDLKLFIVQDADRINSLGAIGIMRYVSYNIKNSKSPSFKEIISNMENRTKKLMTKIRTKSGREIANNQVILVNLFINNYKLFIR